ncbi:MAG: anti-sigma factor antagonist [Planctomycetaceae bacterium]|nr:MAG: anti-sigma factor antagonist [Planctomycetaceae bacterium]
MRQRWPRSIMGEIHHGRKIMTRNEYFRIEQGDRVTCLRFLDTSRLDTDDYAQLQRDLVDFVESHLPNKLIVDLSEIVYCSTALINALLMAERRVRANNGTMHLFGLNEYMLDTLQRLKLVDTIFSICSDESTAQSA